MVERDLVAKLSALEACKKELRELQRANQGLASETDKLKHDIDILSKDCRELTELCRQTDAENQNLAKVVVDDDAKIKNCSAELADVSRNNEMLSVKNASLKTTLDDQFAERQATDEHAKTLVGANHRLDGELSRYQSVNEGIWAELDRRAEMTAMQEANFRNLEKTAMIVNDARSRSPIKRASFVDRSPIRAVSPLPMTIGPLRGGIYSSVDRRMSIGALPTLSSFKEPMAPLRPDPTKFGYNRPEPPILGDKKGQAGK